MVGGLLILWVPIWGGGAVRISAEKDGKSQKTGR